MDLKKSVCCEVRKGVFPEERTGRFIKYFSLGER